MKILYAALLFVLIGIACKNDTPNQSNTAATTTPDSASVTATPQTDPSALPLDAGSAAFPAVPQSQAAPAAGGKLNPAHGQPGHRCDIAVGAPLDSKPAAKGAAAPAQSTTVAVPQPTTAAPGMNPAHGQPGHRCDIAVGAPLDSKPATKQ